MKMLRWAMPMLAITGALAIGAYEMFMRRPLTGRLRFLHTEVVRRERALALSARLVGEHPQTLARLRANDLRALTPLGISDPAIDVLTQCARAANLGVLLVEPGLAETIGPQRRLPLVVQLEGSFAGFMSWLQAIESAQVLVTVDALQMEGGATPEHTFRVSLTTYLFAPEAAPPPVPAVTVAPPAAAEGA